MSSVEALCSSYSSKPNSKITVDDEVLWYCISDQETNSTLNPIQFYNDKIILRKGVAKRLVEFKIILLFHQELVIFSRTFDHLI